MKVKKTCEAYKYRGDYEIDLEKGERVYIRGLGQLIIEPQGGVNTVKITDTKLFKENDN